MSQRSLDYRNLELLEEWQLIRAQLAAMEQDYINEIVDCARVGKTNQMLELSGRVTMIREVLAMPEAMFPGNPKAAL